MADERKGYKKATKAETDSYMKAVNGQGGKIEPGTVFDGQTVWVKNTASSNTSSSESKDKK